MSIFDTNNIAVTLLDYPISYMELTGTIFGLLAVWFAAKENIITWPTSLINVSCFFLVFYQVQLYSDMILQIYFFSISIYGWIVWSKQNKSKEPISILNNKKRLALIITVLAGTVLLGIFMQNIHQIFPIAFEKPASYPFIDSFTTVTSIVASILLAYRILENWILWIIIDVISVVLYFIKDIQLISLEFFIFLIISSIGLYTWTKTYKLQHEGSNLTIE